MEKEKDIRKLLNDFMDFCNRIDSWAEEFRAWIDDYIEEKYKQQESSSYPPPSDSFDQILREEFLINSQNFPEEYHELFWKKYKRAEERFKNQ